MSKETKNIVRLKKVPVGGKFRFEGKELVRGTTPSFFGGSESKGLVYAVDTQQSGTLLSGNTEVEYPVLNESEKKNKIPLHLVPVGGKFIKGNQKYTKVSVPLMVSERFTPHTEFVVDEQGSFDYFGKTDEVEYPIFNKLDDDDVTFKKGDIVRLKSGGPNLIVTRICLDELECISYSEKGFVYAIIPCFAVEKLSLDGEYTPFEKEVIGSLEQFTKDLESGRSINANPVHIFDWIQLLDRNTIAVVDYQTQEDLMRVLGRIRQFMGRPAKTTS